MDYETTLIGAQNLAPRPICLSLAHQTQGTHLVTNGDPEWVEYQKGLIDACLEDPEMIIVAHNAKFDMHVLARDVNYYAKICELYARGQIQCTILRQKLINLTTTGWVDKEPKDSDDEEGSGKKIEYNLAFLVKDMLNIDISMEKEKEDSVRTRYQELDGIPAERYPREFRDYSIQDSELLLKIYEIQEERRETIKDLLDFDPFATLKHRCELDFHLYRWTMEGVRTNPEQIERTEKMLEEELSYEKLNLLYENFILRPFQPEAISYRYTHSKECSKEKDPNDNFLCDCPKKPAISHLEGCNKKKDKFTKEFICDCPPMMKAEQKEKLNGSVLKEHVLNLWSKDPDKYDLLFSDSATDKEGNWVDPDMSIWDDFQDGRASVEEVAKVLKSNLRIISTKREWLDTFSFKDPILAQYDHRASLIKLQTTELPRMKNEDGTVAEVVHGNFDVLKETGRTSGFASKLCPSANLQNIHKLARSCFKAREGHWILSVDYSGLEFVSAGQRALDALGTSMYATIINNGWDSHGYLGAQRAVRSEEWFAKEVTDAGHSLNDYEQIYHMFHAYKKKDKELGYYEGKVDDKGNPVKKMFWKHYRGSAKPIGLGILGGMGPKTIAHVSGATYKIDMTIREAEEYKAIWEEIFQPEAELIRRINLEKKDPQFSTRKKPRFRYVTPMGMVRPNCSFAACSNGDILQSPSAEGATLACIAVGRACYDPTSTSILKDNFKPWAFVHDEILGDVVASPEIATKVATELERVMCEALKVICPDINPSADSALQIEWNKSADRFVNRDGYLVPWEVKFNKELAKELNYV